MITPQMLADWAKALEPFADRPIADPAWLPDVPDNVGVTIKVDNGRGRYIGKPRVGDFRRARAAKASIEAELKAMEGPTIDRLTAALADAPDMASVHVLAGDLRKVLGLT